MKSGELEAPETADLSTTLLADYAAAWLDMRVDLAERTVELYRWLLRRHIQPAFGATSLDSISPQAVRAWHSGIAKEHPTTAAKAYRLLSSILRTAVSDEILPRTPARSEVLRSRRPRNGLLLLSPRLTLLLKRCQNRSGSLSILPRGASSGVARFGVCVATILTSPRATSR